MKKLATKNYFKYRRNLYVAVCLVVFETFQLAEPCYAQSFKEAVSIAIQNSVSLKAEAERLGVAKETRVQAENLKRPNIQFDAGAGLASNGQWLGPYGAKKTLWSGTEPIDASITLSQPLLSGGRYQASKREAELRIAQQKAKYKSLELQVVQQVLESYFDVLRDYAIYEVRKEGINNLEKQLLATKSRQELGLIGKTDVAQVETRLSAARGQAASAKARLASSWISLTRFVGEEPIGLTEREIDIPIPETKDEAIEYALKNNIDIKIAWFNEDLARANANIIKTETAPKLSLNLSSGYNLDGGINGARSIDNQLNLKLTVPIWSGGQNSSRIRSSLGEASAYRYDALDLERQLKEKVSIGFESFYAATENEKFANQQVINSEVAREGTELEQRIGARTTLDVLNQEQELLDARINQINARREKANSAISLSILMGLDPTKTININEDDNIGYLLFDKTTVNKVGIVTKWEKPLVKLFDALIPVDGAVKRGAKEITKKIGKEN